jgi:uncharacterized membrane protein YphA (DoxX/SURF4 family)
VRSTALTAHTKRAIVSSTVLFCVAALHDVVRSSDLVLEHWASLLAVVSGIVWLMSGVEAIAKGTPHLIAQLIGVRAAGHPVALYRSFVARFLVPRAKEIGYVVPVSQILVAISYFSGVLVQLAAVGALLLLLNFIVFQRITRPRDDFVVLVPLQVVVLTLAPGGLVELARAVVA